MPIFRRERRRRVPGPEGAFRWVVTRQLLDGVLASAASALPNEFGAVLRADPPGVISEMLLVPGTTAGRRHANFQFYMLHADLSVVGTVHSHPSGALHPSGADVQLFRNWGSRHLILGRPFGPSSWRAYDSRGEPVPLPVVGPDGTVEGTLPEGRPRPAIHRGDDPPVP
ncbi:MAG: Mov34/MPN/PAD-1 family protein [Thermoplasmata archaeon]